MRLPSRLLGALLAGGHVRSPLEDWPPSLSPNHGRSVRGAFAQVQGSRCREDMGFSMVIDVSGEADPFHLIAGSSSTGSNRPPGDGAIAPRAVLN